MKSVCFRNIPPYTREGLLNLFSKCGAVQCLFIRHRRTQSLAFVCFENEDVVHDAIKRFQNWDFGNGTMTAQLSKTECARRHDSTPSNMSPSKNLHVFNFDTINTTVTDLETHFNKYGEIVNVCIVEDYAFVNFARQEDATTALEGTHMRDFGGRLLKADYSNSPRGSGSPVTRHHGHSRSCSRITSRSRVHSRSHSRITRRSRVHSRSRSPITRRSRSRSPITRRSRVHSRSRSPVTRRSRSRSRITCRSRVHSRSRSPVTRRSRSHSPVTRRSRSHSPVTRRSRSRRESAVYNRYEGPSSYSRSEGYKTNTY